MSYGELICMVNSLVVFLLRDPKVLSFFSIFSAFSWVHQLASCRLLTNYYCSGTTFDHDGTYQFTIVGQQFVISASSSSPSNQ